MHRLTPEQSFDKVPPKEVLVLVRKLLKLREQGVNVIDAGPEKIAEVRKINQELPAAPLAAENISKN